ncbi:MAG: YihY/virulence factor BrkB family protein [Bdellovibrionota bacterium]
MKELFSSIAKALKKTFSDDVLFDGAAALSYYFLVAIFPGLFVLFSMVSYLPVEDLSSHLQQWLESQMPQKSSVLFMNFFHSAAGQRRSGMFTSGFFLALWTASNGMSAIMRQLNRIYKVKEKRNVLVRKLVSIGLTFVFGVFMVTCASMTIFWGILSKLVLSYLHLDLHSIPWGIYVGNGVAVGLMMMLTFSLVYTHGVCRNIPYVLFSRGNIVVVVLFFLISSFFSFTISKISNHSLTYGSLASVVILLLWFYVLDFSCCLVQRFISYLWTKS